MQIRVKSTKIQGKLAFWHNMLQLKINFLLTATGDQLWFDHTVQQSIPVVARFLAGQIRHFLDSGQYFPDLFAHSPEQSVVPEVKLLIHFVQFGNYFSFDLALGLFEYLVWVTGILIVLLKLAQLLDLVFYKKLVVATL